MSKTTRGAILFSFFGLFAIIAPIIIFYASGYRYNTAKNKIEKTGILFIKTDPIDTDIFIDGKLTIGQDQADGRRFTNLLPNSYQIKIAKEGYYPWIKRLDIKSQLTTFANNVFLFQTDAAVNELLTDKNISRLQMSPDKKSLLTITADGAIFLINLDKNHAIKQVGDLTEIIINNMAKILWSPNSEKILLTTATDEYYLIDLNTNETSRLINSGFTGINWSISKPSILYGLKNQNLYQIDIDADIASQLNIDLPGKTLGEIIAFEISEPNLFLVIKKDGGTSLQKHDLNTGQTVISPPIALAGQIEFLPSLGDYLTITDGKKLLLFDDKLELVLTASAKTAEWISPTELLYYNDFEIYTYNITAKKSEMINRYSQIITAAAWYYNKNYIVVNLNDSRIDIIELDNRDKRNIWTIGNMDSIKNLSLDNTGEYLYFIGATKNGEAISPPKIYSQRIH